MKRKKSIRKKICITHKKWRYVHLGLLIAGVIAAFYLSRWQVFHDLLLSLGAYGYLGAFIGGMLFVSTSTVATGLVILLVLFETHSLIGISLVAGLGGVVGDLAIFHFVRDELAEDITPLYNKFGGKHLTILFHSKYFHWTLPVIGALIIASPLPDELGVSLMGIARMKTRSFLILSYVLNTCGILATLAMGAVLIR